MLGVLSERKGVRMEVTLRDSIERVSDPVNLDASVEEVFATMLAVAVTRREKMTERPETGSVTGVVGFGGVLSGACILSTTGRGARILAERMTGMQFEEVDATVQDAIGELSNMLAGSWKSKVPELAAHCGLSVPAVISGSDYNLHVQEPAFELRHVYGFDGVCFEVTIVCDGVR
jgi:chemotaxis protein CheX